MDQAEEIELEKKQNTAEQFETSHAEERHMEESVKSTIENEEQQEQQVLDTSLISSPEHSENSTVEEEKECESSSQEGTAEKEEGNSQTQKKASSQQLQDGFAALLEKIKAEESCDEKLKIAVENMEIYLSQGGTPRFKCFWELRKLCLDLFKDNISPAVRSSLWPKYSHLSKEARRLKEMFDEQSAFAVEQIDIAISALEAEIQNFEDAVINQSELEFSEKSQFLEKKKEFYTDLQKRLNLLNTYAARINNLRKELMKTDMRIKHKNKFFQRLSSAGDHVFPVRKDLIKKISDQFSSDVDYFVKRHFGTDQIKGPIFQLREEIKALQSFAKLLTLNTHSFTTTRLRLSECWDRLKSIHKEHKKELSEKKDLFLENKANVDAKITDLKSKFESAELSTGAAYKILDEIQQFMRKVELGRDEVKALKTSLGEVKDIIQAKKKEEEAVRLEEEREKLRLKKEQIDTVKSEIETVFAEKETLSVEEITKKNEDLIQKLANLKDLNGKDKHDLERSLRRIKDLLSAKKEEALLNLSDDDQQSLKNLREVLSQRRVRRREIKEQYDQLRKASGSSGLDFEQAMLHNDQVQAEKERLDEADHGLEEIEKKIRDIKNKVS